MDNYTAYQRFPDNYPMRPNVALTIWNALWPPALYIAMQTIVALVGSVMLNISLSLSNDYASMSYEEIMALTNDYLDSWLMPMMIISMVLCLAVFIPFYIRFRRGQEKQISLPGLGAGNIFLILVLTVSSYFVILSVLSFLPQNFGNYAQHMESLSMGTFPMQLLVVGIGAPIVEELCLRGMTQDRLMKIMPPFAAIALQAVIFGIIHFNIVQGSYAFMLGLLLGWLCWRSRSLWAAILCHFFMNAGNVLLGEFLDRMGEFIEAGEDMAGESAGDPYAITGTLIILAFALACSAALIYVLNKTLPGRGNTNICLESR